MKWMCEEVGVGALEGKASYEVSKPASHDKHPPERPHHLKLNREPSVQIPEPTGSFSIKPLHLGHQRK